MKYDNTNELKSVRRTRKTVNLMLWVIVAGAVFYSLMTSTPLVAAHSVWSRSGWALGMLTDAAFILSISADAVLSKHGLSGGKWATAFRWTTGLASLFLNTWSSVAHGDWVGVAIHSIAPVILVCAAEVAPAYRRKFREVELNLTGEVHSEPVQSLEVQSELVQFPEVQFSEVQSLEVHSEPAVSELVQSLEVQSSRVQSEPVQFPEVQFSEVHSELVQSPEVQSSGSPTDNQKAIEGGFLAGRKAADVAREIGVSGSYVSSRYRKLRAAQG